MTVSLSGRFGSWTGGSAAVHTIVGTGVVVPVRLAAGLVRQGELEPRAGPGRRGRRRFQHESKTVGGAVVGTGQIGRLDLVAGARPAVDRVEDRQLLVEGDVGDANDAGHGQPVAAVVTRHAVL